MLGMYEIVSLLGTGSYGYVYKVRESRPLSRILALKVLRLDQTNAKVRTNFLQEARRIAMMQHPNILPVYNFGQLENGQPYIVMEYAPQTILDLFTNTHGERRLAFAEELLPYVRQAADTLQYVHNAKLVHQDVKPANLLIGRNGQLLLADFGTTYYLGNETHASLGEVTGTAAYMPTEQWQGNPRRDTDQYALAICCYELLTGRRPFLYSDLKEMWTAHMQELPPPPQRWNPRIPVEVAAVLLRALAKDYRARYASITQFAESYMQAVRTAQRRYTCHHCGQQNRTGAQRCTLCGAAYDNRTCPYCDAPLRFGQRCCTRCGRLTFPLHLVEHSPLVGVSVGQARYSIQRVLTQSEERHVTTAIALDTHNNNQRVFLKRWECTHSPLAQRAKDIAYYDRATQRLANLHHPLLPAVLNRFAEDRYYYLVFAYIDGESLDERLQRLLTPLSERDVLGYMNTLLNILSALEQQGVRHYAISPANILIEQGRGRVFLTGFPVDPPRPEPGSHAALAQQASQQRGRTTRRLNISPYLPLQDSPYDQRTCLYMLAASMHHVSTGIAPPHYPTYPLVRMFNPAISPELEAILSHALLEDPKLRYQSYDAMRRDVQKLLFT
jgi:serine/threonine protein kinase